MSFFLGLNWERDIEKDFCMENEVLSAGTNVEYV